jgi:ubiquinone/menaquinone biosynthesis C-methylase UbiE
MLLDASTRRILRSASPGDEMLNEQREFWSKVATKYDRVVDLQIGPRARSMVRERVEREGALGRLVELGCGSGYFTAALAPRAESIVATDISPGMLALAKDRVKAANVTFQVEDCQQTSFADGAFDTAFISLVLHFTEPAAALAEMRRILKRGGTLIIVNLDMLALTGMARVRCLVRVAYRGLTGYAMKPPKGFGRNLLTEKQLCELLGQSGFDVAGAETIRDAARSSSIPLEYVRAVKV